MSTAPQQFVPPPGAPPPQAAPPRRRNGLGVTSLVLGILAVLFAFIPLVGMFVAIPLAILAILFGAFGFIPAFRGRASKGLPIAGVVLGILGLILAIVALNATDKAINGLSETNTTDTSGSDTSGGDTSGTATGGDTKPATKGIGDPVRDGGMQYTVTHVKSGVKQVGDPDFGETADGKYSIVSVTLKNVDHKPHTFDDSLVKAYTAKGDEYNADGTADLDINSDDTFLKNLNPGSTVKVKLAFDVPKKAHLAKIVFQESMLSDGGVTVSLK